VAGTWLTAVPIESGYDVGRCPSTSKTGTVRGSDVEFFEVAFLIKGYAWLRRAKQPHLADPRASYLNSPCD